MANGDRWRNDQDWRNPQEMRREQEWRAHRNEDRDRWRSDDRDRWRDQGGRSDFSRGESDVDYREGRGSWYGGTREGSSGGGYGMERYGDAYHGARDFAAGSGADYGWRSGRDYGGGGGPQNRYGGNDYLSGNYGADQDYSSRGSRDYRDYGQRGSHERGFWDRASDEVSSWFGDDDAERRRRNDMREGDHRGRGPKGYTRSDERIREDVSDRLSDDPFVDASEIEVTVATCEVTLSGTVDSREAKRRAEDIADRVTGVRHVQNNLRIQSTTSDAMRSAGATGASGTMTGAQGTGSSRKSGTNA